MLQRLGASKVTRNGADTQDSFSFESCMSSVACDIEEMSSETSRITQEKETPEVTVLWNEAEGVAVNLEGERHRKQAEAKKF